MIKIFFTIIITIFLVGCSTTKPAITEYQLSLKELNNRYESNGCKDKSLKVSQAFSSSSLMSLEMSYVQAPHNIYSYSQAQWNNSPNQEITSQVVKALRDSKMFANTQSSKSRSKSDLVLEVNIEDFMQYYSKELDKSYVKVTISFALIDFNTNKVLADETFTSTQDVSTLNASGGVVALNQALMNVLNQSLEFLDGVCK
nr:ABC-type transport auxiliary lipoprotein family protein [uncultured Sulfurimonas sp.]